MKRVFVVWQRQVAQRRGRKGDVCVRGGETRPREGEVWVICFCLEWGGEG